MATHRQIIAKALFAGALAFGLFVEQAAAAGADDVDPNPFRGLSCNCPNTTTSDSPAALGEIHRGLREGHTAWLPDLPA